MSENATRRIVLALAAILFAVTLVVMTSSLAKADPTPAPRGLYVSYVEPTGPVGSGAPWIIGLSNGKFDLLRPCKFEDGRHCYWQANSMGNNVGQSFIVTRGHVFKMNLRGL